MKRELLGVLRPVAVANGLKRVRFRPSRPTAKPLKSRVVANV